MRQEWDGWTIRSDAGPGTTQRDVEAVLRLLPLLPGVGDDDIRHWSFLLGMAAMHGREAELPGAQEAGDRRAADELDTLADGAGKLRASVDSNWEPTMAFLVAVFGNPPTKGLEKPRVVNRSKTKVQGGLSRTARMALDAALAAEALGALASADAPDAGEPLNAAIHQIKALASIDALVSDVEDLERLSSHVRGRLAVLEAAAPAATRRLRDRGLARSARGAPRKEAAAAVTGVARQALQALTGHPPPEYGDAGPFASFLRGIFGAMDMNASPRGQIKLRHSPRK